MNIQPEQGIYGFVFKERTYHERNTRVCVPFKNRSNIMVLKGIIRFVITNTLCLNRIFGQLPCHGGVA